MKLADILMKYLVLPAILGGISSVRRKEYHLSITISTFILVQILNIIKYPPVVNLVSCVLLLKEIRREVLDTISNNPPLAPASYSFECRFDQTVFVKEEEQPSENIVRIGALMLDYIDNIEEPENLTPNETRTFLFQFLRSRDDNLITLTLLLFSGMLFSPSVNRSLLSNAGLLPQNQMKRKDLIASILVDSKESQEEAKGKPEGNYSTEMMDMLLKLINIEPPFRLMTCKLICKLIMALCYRPELKRCLLKEHEYLVNKAFKRTINNVRRLVKNPYYNDVFMEFFENEWENVRRFSIKEKINCPTNLLLPVAEEFTSSIPLHQRLPCGEFEVARVELHLFFLYRKLKYLLAQEDIPQDYDIDEYPLKYLKSNTHWQVNKTYSVESNTCIRCTLREGKLSTVRYLVEDEDHFILAEADPYKMNFAKVTHLTNLRNIEAMADRADPRTLVVAMKKDRDSSQLYLTFDDPSKCLGAKRKIEEHRMASRQYDLSLVESLLDSLESSIFVNNSRHG